MNLFETKIYGIQYILSVHEDTVSLLLAYTEIVECQHNELYPVNLRTHGVDITPPVMTNELSRHSLSSRVSTISRTFF